MKVGVIGAGFASYLYGGTFGNHKKIEITGIFDTDASRRHAWAERYGVTAHDSLERLLDSDVELVVNVTNPRAHFTTTREALIRGKHVYTEKPLAKTVRDARELVHLARDKGVHLSGAPCSLLGDTAQTLWHAIRSGVIGKVHTAVVSASEQMDSVRAMVAAATSLESDGAFRLYHERGGPPVDWPFPDESDVGCAYEHIAYPLKWLTSWFGPVTRVSSYSSLRRPTKQYLAFYGSPALRTHTTRTPDLYVSCLSLRDDVEVVMLNSVVVGMGPEFQLFGDDGSLSVEKQWNYSDVVWVNHGMGRRYVYPHVRSSAFRIGYAANYEPKMDYARGVADLIEAIGQGRPSPFSCSLEQEIHIQEVTDFIAATSVDADVMRTSFSEAPIPLPISTQPVGIGVVGCGDVAETYLKELSGAEGCYVVGAVSLTADPSRAQALLQRAELGGAEVFTSLDELLRDERVHMVLNLSSPNNHAVITKQSLEAGKHVFSEKPLACTLVDARAVEAAAQLRGLRVGVAPGSFLGDSQQAIIKAVAEGMLGQVRHVVANLNHGCIELWHPNPQPILDFGIYADVAPYALALVTKVLGSVLRVSASGEVRTPKRRAANGQELSVTTPDAVRAHLTFFSGATMELNVDSWSTDPKWYRERPSSLELRGTKRALRLTPPLAANGLVQWVDVESGKTAPFERAGQSRPAFQLALGALEMKDSIRSGALPACRLDHAVHVVDILDAIGESMVSGEAIFLHERTGVVHSSWV